MCNNVYLYRQICAAYRSVPYKGYVTAVTQSKKNVTVKQICYAIYCTVASSIIFVIIFAFGSHIHIWNLCGWSKVQFRLISVCILYWLHKYLYMSTLNGYFYNHTYIQACCPEITNILVTVVIMHHSSKCPASIDEMNAMFKLDDSAFFRTQSYIYKVCFLDGKKTFLSPVQSNIKPN